MKQNRHKCAKKTRYKLNSLKRKTNLFYIITEELAMSLRLYLSPRFSVPLTRMEHQSRKEWVGMAMPALISRFTQKSKAMGNNVWKKQSTIRSIDTKILHLIYTSKYRYKESYASETVVQKLISNVLSNWTQRPQWKRSNGEDDS